MDKTELKEKTLQEEIKKARKAAEIADASEPRADSAYYDSQAGLIVINLKNGATFSFPPTLAQGLATATPEELSKIEVTPSGDGLHWEKLDLDFSIPALLAGVFGTKAWMATIIPQEIV